MKKAAKITLTALSAAAACGAAVYGVTHVLMDVAMNRPAAPPAQEKGRRVTPDRRDAQRRLPRRPEGGLPSTGRRAS